jgi:hypothetical protein
MPHNHPLFKVDNGLTFDVIKTSVYGMMLLPQLPYFVMHEMGVAPSLICSPSMLGKQSMISLSKMLRTS